MDAQADLVLLCPMPAPNLRSGKARCSTEIVPFEVHAVWSMGQPVAAVPGIRVPLICGVQRQGTSYRLWKNASFDLLERQILGLDHHVGCQGTCEGIIRTEEEGV